jgi:PAS domain S-box-containing protein
MKHHFLSYVIKEGNNFNKEYRIIRSNDKKTIWVHGIGKLEYDEKGNVVKMIGTVQDISERKSIERKISEKDKRLRDIVYAMGDWVWEVDERGVYTFSSSNSLKHIGRTSKEIIGKTPFDFMPEAEAKRVGEIFKDIVVNKAQIKDLKNWNIKKNGEKICLLTNGVPIIDDNGNYKGYRGVDKDITERILTQELLVESEQKYRYLFNTMNEGVIKTDSNDIILMVNPKFCDLLGYSENELVGKKASNTFLFSLNDKKIILDKINKRQKEVEDIYEIAIKNKKGEKRWHLVSGSPTYDVNGNIDGSLGIHTDITEKKELEKQLQFTLNNLEKLVADRTKKLKQTTHKLELSYIKEKELGELKSRFVSTASHQFRTPLTVIKSNIELIQMFIESLDDKNKKNFNKACNRVQGEVKRMTNLMDDVLVIGKIKGGSIQLNKKPKDIVLITDSIVVSYNDIQNDGRKIKLNVHGEPYKINVDGQLLEHSISNLISNAFKYSVGKPEPLITIDFNKERVKISIKDFGMGIPSNELVHLFETFYRASNVVDLPGTGLGIAIAKEYVELNGGEIDVVSILNEGSEFTITFKKS